MSDAPPAEPMLRTVRATVEYDGTDFDGWQVQPGRRTVQGEIEAAIRQITRQKVRVMGAGRTDKGVHAAGQVASFEITTALSLDALERGVSAILPRDVAFFDAAEVPFGWSARRNAASREYVYRIARRRSPLARRNAWEMWARLDLARVRAASALLVGDRDMRAFSVGLPPERNTRVRLARIDWREEETPTAPLLVAEFEANRFLRGMVRRLVGSLILVGRGKWTLDDVARARDSLDARSGGPSAPACGLTLHRVRYANPARAST
ncbi:MAG: tRNA pseudouridine(38-40) synthase TruA [bacterium]